MNIMMCSTWWWCWFVVRCWLCLSRTSSFRLPTRQMAGAKASLNTLFAASTNAKPLIVGLNKYSHDTSACIIDAQTGEVLFAQAKERFSRRKHDGGDVSSLLREGLHAIDACLEDIALVVSNNHHFRVMPFERRLSFSTAIRSVPQSYRSEYNLIPKATHLELSHHLAHAWSAMASAPFVHGIVVVMDGMGESYKAMMEDLVGTEAAGQSDEYMHDLKLIKQLNLHHVNIQPTSSSFLPGSTYREAETAYTFNKDKGLLLPVFKRWSRERSPSELYNHGFENMESIGAVYSRLSSHILGNWNACGKVMGLSSWHAQTKAAAQDWFYGSNEKGLFDDLALGQKSYPPLEFMKGNPVDGSFLINWDVIESLRDCNNFSNDKFDYFAHLANSVQVNTEDVVMKMLHSLQQQTKETNLVLVGGVALNSVLNGKVARSKLFNHVHVPCAPGDEGIAVGCAMYGLHRYREMVRAKQPDETEADQNDYKKHDQSAAVKEQKSFYFPTSLRSPHHGLPITVEDLEESFYEYDAWIDVEELEDEEALVEDAAQALQGGKVIAWFQGRSELGQRALGGRSILANPQLAQHRRFVNQHVKHREWYRPLAPSVLAEHISEWFEDIPEGSDFSPFMSFTAAIKPHKIAQIPAVAHIDGTARLQSVSTTSFPLYYKLIAKFFAKTKIPMVLNTSLNGKDQPILEKPVDAVKALINSAGAIDCLYLEGYKVSLKTFPLNSLQQGPSKDEEAIVVQAQPLYLHETTSTVAGGVLRVRIQDVGSGGYSAGNEEEDAWLELPSVLHLNILKLLQASAFVSGNNNVNEVYGGGFRAVDDFTENGDGFSVRQLWDEIGRINTECNNDVKRSVLCSGKNWTEVCEALRWLYHHALLSFE